MKLAELNALDRNGFVRLVGPVFEHSPWIALVCVPTVMMCVQSIHFISQNKIEDTKEEHLELCVTAFDKLAEKAMGWIN